MTLRRRVIRSSLAFAAVAATVMCAAAVQSRRAAADQAAPVPEPADAPVRPLRGQTTPAAWQAIRDAEPAHGGGYMAIALQAADCFTCEDLGRQLRELRHARGAGERTVVVVTTPLDLAVVRAWLRKERVVPVRLVAVDGGVQLIGTGPVPTPAVMLLDSAGRVERGIAHPQRVPNVRLVSFAAELELD
jgi:hypothetical protein